MEIVLIRHAEPEWVRDGAGQLDPRLTERGREQARLLGEHARALRGPTELFVSPMRRARETAEPLAETFGIAPRELEWLEEVRLPRDWEGAPADRISAALRAARHRPAAAWWDGLEGGETFRDFHGRVTRGLTGLLTDRGVEVTGDEAPHAFRGAADLPHRIFIVAHGGTNAVALTFLLGLLPVPWEWERFASLHASITRARAVDVAGGRIFALSLFGGVEHLPKPLRTR
ncbi:MAG: histidine phosphatase family protein [Deltaproteobacteria bacterium]|nr:histidine phosphatase family protein [Deltaproteobacteria bacterium]